MRVSGCDSRHLPLRLDHVAILVRDIESYLTSSFWSLRSPVVHDPIQRARLCLVSIAKDDSHLVELIEPIGEGSPTYRALARGQKLHHLCFRVSCPQIADGLIDKYRLLPVTEWQPAVLFEGRPVRFAYTQYRELVEFVADECAEG